MTSRSKTRVLVALVAASLGVTIGADRAYAQIPPVSGAECIDERPGVCDSLSGGGSSDEGSSGGGEVREEDPAIAERRAAAAAEARAAWERASANAATLAARGRSLEEERQAFRRLFDGAGEEPGLVVRRLVRVPVVGGGAPAGGARASSPVAARTPPPARGLRLAGPPPPPLTDDRWRPVSSFDLNDPPVAGRIDAGQLVDQARGRILDETRAWLTEQALDEMERRLPGVMKRARSIYGTLEHYGEILQDMNRENGTTIDAIFRGAREVVTCNSGRPCDAAFVDSLPETRGREYCTWASNRAMQEAGPSNVDVECGDTP